ncbi:hypothetical protein GE061_017917, partial [Apolygus lucorum]
IRRRGDQLRFPVRCARPLRGHWWWSAYYPDDAHSNHRLFQVSASSKE